MSPDYRQSHLAERKGQSYSRQFSENPYRSMLWELEQGILDRIVRQFDAAQKIQHLDFACGTGRIIEYLQKFETISSVGIDVSPSMLQIAHQRLKHSQLIQADITEEDILGDRMFDLITAFRFFPNAQPELRLEAMRVLITHLDAEGYLVFNNHRNLSSSTNLLARLLGRGGNVGMSHTEVQSLVSSVGMTIEKVYHIGVIPSTERHLLLPRPLLRFLERAASRCPMLQTLAGNLIFVCKGAQQ